MECEAGCKSYDGGERKHHKDCPHYAESFSKMFDDQAARIEAQAAEIERLREVLGWVATLSDAWPDDGGNVQIQEFSVWRELARAALSKEGE